MDFQKILRWIDVNKEGAVIGALFSMIMYFLSGEGKVSYFDKIIQTLPVGTYMKLAAILFIGLSIGALMDSVFKPRK